MQWNSWSSIFIDSTKYQISTSSVCSSIHSRWSSEFRDFLNDPRIFFLIRQWTFCFDYRNKYCWKLSNHYSKSKFSFHYRCLVSTYLQCQGTGPIADQLALITDQSLNEWKRNIQNFNKRIHLNEDDYRQIRFLFDVKWPLLLVVQPGRDRLDENILQVISNSKKIQSLTKYFH